MRVLDILLFLVINFFIFFNFFKFLVSSEERKKMKREKNKDGKAEVYIRVCVREESDSDGESLRFVAIEEQCTCGW